MSSRTLLRGLAIGLAIFSASCTKQDGGASINEPFVVGIRQVGEVYDPSHVLPSEVSAVGFNVYDWLFDRNHKGQAAPGIAESWEMSPDARVLTVKLRPGVTFQNGSPLTADDLVFSWARYIKGGFSTRISRSLDKIEVVDPLTAKFYFGKPEIGFVPFGGFAVMSKAYYEKVGEQAFKTNPIGTGPYRIKALARGRYVDLERYDGYWGPKPELKNARFAFVTEDTTRVAQLRAGEADMAMQVPFPLVTEIETDPNLKTVTLSPSGTTIFLAMKIDNPKTPWADKRVREAIALSIDHDSIIKNILRGHPTYYPFLAPNDVGYDATLKPYPYDPARAKQLLKEAGVTNLTIELPYISGATTGLKETAEAVALYMRAVGITATAKPIEGPQFISWVLEASRNPKQDYIAVFIGATAGTADSSSGLLTHFSTATPFAWYIDPEINRMAFDMASTPDEAARAEKIRTLGQAVHADYRYVPLWSTAHIYGMKKCIDFTPTLGSYDLIMLRDVKVSRCAAKAAK